MRILGYVYLFAFIFLSSFLYAGSFSVGVYGNMEGYYNDNYSVTTSTNGDWKTTYVGTYYQLKMSGKNMAGFDILVNVSASADLYNKPFAGDYASFYFTTNDGINSTLSAAQDYNFRLRDTEIHLYKQLPILKTGKLGLTLYMGEDRNDVGQPFLDFFGSIGEANTRTGIQWDAYGLWGFVTKGFILDYRSTYADTNSASDMWAYVTGFRVSRDIIKKTPFTWNMGYTAGFNMYFKKDTTSDLAGSTSSYIITNKYYYNVMGFDTTINGDLRVLGTYYLFAGFGRSYTPEYYTYEYSPLIGVLGNTNAMIYDGEFKWNKKFETADVQLGQLFVGLSLYGRQPRYQTFMGGSGDSKYYETGYFSYYFPYKQISLNGRTEYFHNYGNFSTSQYHIWQAGTITDSSASLRDHIDLNISFKSGFTFNVAYDMQYGLNYLGKFLPSGVSFLTLTTAGETSLGKISPQCKIVALNDTNKILVSSGIEIFLNLSKWLTFYSRFAYVQSAGYWKVNGEVNWWTAYMQLQFKPGDNSNIFLQIGNGNDTSSGFVSDYTLINGTKFNKMVYLKFEYWL